MATENLHGKCRFAAILLFLLTMVAASAHQATEYFSLRDSLVFDGTEYHLAFSANPGDSYFVQEYLPKGEDFDNYSSMFTISLLGADISPAQAIQSKMAELDARKKVDSVCNYMVANRGKEYMLDFIVSDAPTGDFNTVEFDVHRYFTTKIKGRKYLVLLFYSERSYGDDITSYMQNLADRRNYLLSQMGTFPIPVFLLTK